MKIDFTSPYVLQAEIISPDVYKAQRMAELEQLAKYRALKLQKYKDWSDPEKRKAIIIKLEEENEDARKKFQEIEKKYPDLFRSKDLRKLDEIYLVSGKSTEIRPKWYQKILQKLGL